MRPASATSPAADICVPDLKVCSCERFSPPSHRKFLLILFLHKAPGFVGPPPPPQPVTVKVHTASVGKIKYIHYLPNSNVMAIWEGKYKEYLGSQWCSRMEQNEELEMNIYQVPQLHHVTPP